LKSEEYTKFPYLFHSTLDNEPLTACLEASQAPPILNEKKGAGGWMMPRN